MDIRPKPQKKQKKNILFQFIFQFTFEVHTKERKKQSFASDEAFVGFFFFFHSLPLVSLNIRIQLMFFYSVVIFIFSCLFLLFSVSRVDLIPILIAKIYSIFTQPITAVSTFCVVFNYVHQLFLSLFDVYVLYSLRSHHHNFLFLSFSLFLSHSLARSFLFIKINNIYRYTHTNLSL